MPASYIEGKNFSSASATGFYLQQVQLVLGILTLTKFELIFAEKPRVQYRKLFLHMCRRFDWTQMVTPFFRSSVWNVCIHNFQKSPIKFKRKQEPSTRIIPRKEWSEHTLTNTFDSRKSEEKKKAYKGERDLKSSIDLVITCENTSQFLE